MAATEHFWSPNRFDESHTSINTTTYLCDANGEYCAYIGKVPKTGTLTRFEFNLGAVANVVNNGIRCSFQDPNATTGVPDGGVDQSVTITAGAQIVGWVNPGDFDSTRAVTAGDYLCCVIENPSFTAGDSFAVGAYIYSSNQGLPYGLRVAGTKEGVTLPIIALRYNDGTYETLLGCETWPSKSIGSIAFQEDTSPDEAGLAFFVDKAYTLYGVSFQVSPSAGVSTTYAFNLYDSALLQTQTLDTDVGSATSGNKYYSIPLATPLLLSPGTVYRATLAPVSTTSDMTMYYDSFESAAIMDALEFGSDWYMTTRVNGGAWTDYNNSSDGFRRPHISLKLAPPTGGGGSAGGPRPLRVNRR